MFINNFDPVAFNFFSLEIRWYSLAYIFGIIIGWFYCKRYLIKDRSILNILKSKRDEIVFKMKLTSKDEFEILSKRVENLEKKINKLNNKKKQTRRARKS